MAHALHVSTSLGFLIPYSEVPLNEYLGLDGYDNRKQQFLLDVTYLSYKD
jgi:hypothetical protein